ncbi:hypothetical protein AVEN_201494-1 [Araneus ventricosus]|uniref:Uncharacterized protein n=1 Tax=Araneus ventricosus TaxID=182803 RepID=A0A4Y2UK28_ARAVE|nr:hypothetical protein AVEN_135712-1 [Araneus ventricosus]GBO12397.1 hypothetical protein AVEN_6890-1 [Araneus ventricosus]GBO12491.1 hypothetical protein AVEN_79668-1 [Araneus ventricosus]GBO12503.1 hypothetical protein AVEN_201494-1 [Araneus ventricosus]
MELTKPGIFSRTFSVHSQNYPTVRIVLCPILKNLQFLWVSLVVPLNEHDTALADLHLRREASSPFLSDSWPWLLAPVLRHLHLLPFLIFQIFLHRHGTFHFEFLDKFCHDFTVYLRSECYIKSTPYMMGLGV